MGWFVRNQVNNFEGFVIGNGMMSGVVLLLKRVCEKISVKTE